MATPTTPRRFVELITVRKYDLATYRFGTGHPRVGQVSSVELYERVAHSAVYVWDRERQEIRVG